MEFRDLKKQYQVLKKKMEEAMERVAASGAFIMGDEVTLLEHQLSEYVGAKHCRSCAMGTDALDIALKIWGIGAGDAVFVPDFTFFASAEVISLEGATPVFVDVREDTFNIDPVSLEDAIRRVKDEGRLVPKVIIAVDLFGLPADYHAIRQISDKYGLKVLEDGAQGFGGDINGKRACSFGDISTTSFFPAKPLGCYGDGGAIFTDNDEWASLADSYRFHGKGSYKYDNVRVGMNSRLDAIQAAVLQVKLEAFRQYELSDVNKAAALYSSLLHQLVKVPVVPKGYHSSWAQYTIRLEDRAQRDALQKHLKSKGIPSGVYYPTPMHLQSAFKVLDYPSGCCPVSCKLCDTVLSLPVHPYISEEEIEKISLELSSFIK